MSGELDEECLDTVQDAKGTEDVIFSLRGKEKNLDSPINLNIANMTPIYLSELEWHHYEVPPKKVKLTNSGHTAILSAKWFEERPYISGGPLSGNYVFSQIHFHWGCNDMEGSEHTVDGIQYPVEMHVVHFKSTYLTQEAALFEKDGVVIQVYFLKLQSPSNPSLQQLLDSFCVIQNPFTSVRMDATPLSFYIPAFTGDYFFYWGQIKTGTKSHLILWTICREPIGISPEQVDIFRTLLDGNEAPLIRNFRQVITSGNKQIYHANPSGSQYSTLLPIRFEVPDDNVKQKKDNE